MNEQLTENVFILGTGMKVVRRMKLGLADGATVRDVQAPMESLREEEEEKDR